MNKDENINFDEYIVNLILWIYRDISENISR